MSAHVIVTAHLAASAYPNGHWRLKRECHTHAVELVNGDPARVLCEKVKAASVLPDHAMYSDPSKGGDWPTCIVCRRKLRQAGLFEAGRSA